MQNTFAYRLDNELVHRLMANLPNPLRQAFTWVRGSDTTWVRLLLAVLLTIAGVFGFVSVLSFWMLPMGLLLLAEDLPFLCRPPQRGSAMVQGWWDHWQARRGGK